MDKFKWDIRFLNLSREIASWSKDPSTKVGAVVARDKFIVSQGYNGFPPDVEDRPEWLNDRPKRLELVRHAERNAIEFAKDRDLEGCTVYTYPFPPCAECADLIIKAKMIRVVAPSLIPERWRTSMASALRYMRDEEIEITLYDELPGVELSERFFFPTPKVRLDEFLRTY